MQRYPGSRSRAGTRKTKALFNQVIEEGDNEEDDDEGFEEYSRDLDRQAEAAAARETHEEGLTEEMLARAKGQKFE